MKFLKIENKILNTAQIEFVCVNQETIRVDYQEDDPFGESIKEVCGIRVYMVGAHENSYFVFESETIESFYEKLVAA